MQFGDVDMDSLREKENVSDLHGHHLVNLSGERVDEMWNKVSGRTRAAARWCEMVSTLATAKSPWAGVTSRSELWQDRSITVASPGDDEPREREGLPGPPRATRPWKSALKLAIVAEGGAGKTWWLQHQLANGIDDSLHRRIEKLQSGRSPDEIALPIWVSPQTAAKVRDVTDSTALVTEAIAWLVRETGEDLEPAAGARPLVGTDWLKNVLVEMLVEQLEGGTAHLILDAAEQYWGKARQLLARQVDRPGRTWVSTRPMWDEKMERDLATLDVVVVRLQPLPQYAVRQMIDVLADQADDEHRSELAERVATASPVANYPLVVTVAARIKPGDMPREHGPGPLLLEGLRRIWSDNKEAMLSGDVADDDDHGRKLPHDPVVPPLRRILARLGYWQIMAGEDATGPFHVDTSDEAIFPHSLQDRYFLEKLAKGCGLFESKEGDDSQFTFDNDMVRELAVGLALSIDENTHPDLIDIWGLPLRHYVVIDATRIATTMTFAGNFLDLKRPDDDRHYRIGPLVKLLAEPFPLDELPDKAKPAFMRPIEESAAN